MLLVLAKICDLPLKFIKFHSFALFSFGAAFHSTTLIFIFPDLLASFFLLTIINVSFLSLLLISFVPIALILAIFH